MTHQLTFRYLHLIFLTYFAVLIPICFNASITITVGVTSTPVHSLPFFSPLKAMLFVSLSQKNIYYPRAQQRLQHLLHALVLLSISYLIALNTCSRSTCTACSTKQLLGIRLITELKQYTINLVSSIDQRSKHHLNPHPQKTIKLPHPTPPSHSMAYGMPLNHKHPPRHINLQIQCTMCFF